MKLDNFKNLTLDMACDLYGVLKIAEKMGLTENTYASWWLLLDIREACKSGDKIEVDSE